MGPKNALRTKARKRERGEAMYSLLIEPDGSVQFFVHRSPASLDAADARQALELIEPILEELRRKAAVRPLRPPVASGGSVPEAAASAA